MNRPFTDRPPSENEIERLRLLLSTYQDGTGMLPASKGKHRTLPGWRDFERVCAIVFEGQAVENKFFVDVIFQYDQHPNSYYGIDCKMRRELDTAERNQQILVEVTNADRTLWSYLAKKGITKENYPDNPNLAGRSLIQAIEQIKETGSVTYPEGPILINRSHYLVLLWNHDETYQLYQLPLNLPVPDDLIWTCHTPTRRDGTTTSRLEGISQGQKLYEWYGDSGGQFKYFPSTKATLWKSKQFRLEPLHDTVELGIVAKAKMYFPHLWEKTTSNP